MKKKLKLTSMIELQKSVPKLRGLIFRYKLSHFLFFLNWVTLLIYFKTSKRTSYFLNTLIIFFHVGFRVEMGLISVHDFFFFLHFQVGFWVYSKFCCSTHAAQISQLSYDFLPDSLCIKMWMLRVGQWLPNIGCLENSRPIDNFICRYSGFIGESHL